MLADEVTHVKMGSDWLRRVTEGDPERRTKALEFQGVVDKLFCYGGARSDSDESPIGLARRFRELAGFSDDEIDEIAGGVHGGPRRAPRQAARLQAEAAASSPSRERAGARMSWGDRGPLTRFEDMAVTVVPEQFSLVLFDADGIRTCAEALLDRLGMPDQDVRIEVDETSPIARVQCELGDPIVVRAESGAFEDTRRPRHLSEVAVNTPLGRILLKVRDRMSEVRRRPGRRATSAWRRWPRGTPTRRAAGSSRLPGAPPAVALQLPQPARLHRPGRRRVRPDLGGGRPHLGGPRGAVRRRCRPCRRLTRDRAREDTPHRRERRRARSAGVGRPGGAPDHPRPRLPRDVVVLAPPARRSWRTPASTPSPLTSAGTPARRDPDRVEDYGIESLCGDLIALLDEAGHEQAVFVGHDWGARSSCGTWPACTPSASGRSSA